jgi:D-arabinose 1-dehydrogenase-like Zn-dependent alcohol dehydrogenase
MDGKAVVITGGVVDVGEAVSRFAIGDRVTGSYWPC